MIGPIIPGQLEQFSPTVLAAARHILAGDGLSNVCYVPYRRCFEAQVRELGSTRVSVRMDDKERVATWDCRCRKLSGSDGLWPCTHATALLLYLGTPEGNIYWEQYIGHQRGGQVAETLRRRPAGAVTPLSVIPVLVLTPGQPGGRLQLMLGPPQGKLVQNLAGFLEVFLQGAANPNPNEIPDPSISRINEAQRQLMQLMLLCRERIRRRALSLDAQTLSMFLPQLLQMECRFYYARQRLLQPRMELPDMQAQVSRKGNALTVRFTAPVITPLDARGLLLYSDGQLFSPFDAQRETLALWLDVINLGFARFMDADREVFLSEGLTMLEGLMRVELDEALERQLRREELTPRVYLDREGGRVWARVEFCYGQSIINPFSADRPQNGAGLLLRNRALERQVLDVFEHSGFFVLSQRVYLKDDDAVFDFARNGLGELTKLAQVFYADTLRELTVRRNTSVRANLRWLGQGMSQLSLDCPDISQAEFDEAFAALLGSRHYHRLLDGSFLDLTTPEFQSLRELARDLDIKSANQRISSLRALLIDGILREAQLDVTRERMFEEFQRRVGDLPQTGTPPEELQGELRAYQQIGHDWMVNLTELALGGVLADEMGLGKTIQVLSAVLSLKARHGPMPCLVVAPTSLLYNWQAEAQQFAPTLKVLLVTGPAQGRAALWREAEHADLIVTSYPLLKRDLPLCQDLPLRLAILDEAQSIKNADSLGARAAKQLQAQARFAVTGTPMENNLGELWSIFDFILPGYLGTRGHFRAQYEAAQRPDNEALRLRLKEQIRPFLLRRTKPEVLPELPEKIEHVVLTQMLPEQWKLYSATVRRIRQDVLDSEAGGQSLEQSRLKMLSGITRLRQICCHPGSFMPDYHATSGKLEALMDLVNECFSGGHRALVFSQFTSVLQLIRLRLEQEAIPCLYLDGSVPMQTRAELVREFQSGGSAVFLISLRAGGTGLNLTAADTVIHFDPWWNPAVEEQATDRAHRIGQDSIVHVLRLVARNTIEESIYRLHEQKRTLARDLLPEAHELPVHLSGEELFALFKETAG